MFIRLSPPSRHFPRSIHLLQLQAAVKTTRASKSDTRTLLFSLKEALTLAHLPAHPGVAPLLDFARTAKATHLVLALAPGEELFTYVNSKPESRLDETEARKIVAGTLEALRHVHANGVLQ
jgi:serine/threonine protein kinase